MAEDSSSPRLRWLLLLLLLGGVVYVARSRPAVESTPAPTPEPPRPLLLPDGPQPRPVAQRRTAEPAAAQAAPAPVESPTMELPVVDAPGGRRARRTVLEVPEAAALAQPDGSPPGPEYTIKAKSGSELFHGPDSPYFGRTRAEFWFRTAAEARAAGFTEWTPRRRSSSG
ncbi:sunset domain-containing protein [Pseudonocardia humida]|uniref:Uncharacterized protein n=1 Tax=Pseudonocardia humida TaxID=2800819 RepID=A0ABT1A2R3_9PSEU|nr:hypothetical protein [Pseudonocardia humida]MCO1657277.1 hypothetical protein [Pseudonocardia humida]